MRLFSSSQDLAMPKHSARILQCLQIYTYLPSLRMTTNITVNAFTPPHPRSEAFKAQTEWPLSN